VTNLIRSELLRIWSRRMVRVLTILAVLGTVVGVTIGAFQSNKPDLAAAQRAYENDRHQCLAGEMISEDQVPPGESLEEFCADNVRIENYVYGSLRLASLPDFLKGTAFILIVLGLVVGASSAGADWQVGTMAALLTWEPRRMRVLLVRIAVVVVSVFALAVALESVLSLTLAAAAALRGTTVGTESPWLTGVLGTMLRIAGASTLGAWLGVTLAMIGRNTAAALGVAFGYLAVVESLLRSFIPKISGSLLSTNLVVFVDGRAGTSETGTTIAVGGASITIALYAGVLLIVALALFRTRDVT
jgi:ABC-2 type transport system permease protein